MILDFTEEEIEQAFKKWVESDKLSALIELTRKIGVVLSSMPPEIRLLFTMVRGQDHIADGVILAQLMLEERRKNAS